MKSFTRIHIIFAVFFIMAIVTGLFLMLLLGHFHEMPDSEHTLFYLWQPRIEAICFCLKYGATIPWLLFGVFHLVMIITKKLQPEGKH